jgi:hypothetical protein
MKRLLAAWALIMLTISTESKAQSNFDGTWKVDFNDAMPKKINVWVLQNGTFICTSCSPPIEVKADGEDQPVRGQPYDTISVKIVDRHTVREIEKKNGQTVSDEKLTVSADGNTVTDEFGNWKLTMARIAKAPAGAHALSGSWQPLKMESTSDSELLVTYRLEGEIFSMSRPTGQSYTAKLDGTDAPYKGDPDTNGVAVKRISKNVLEETDKLNGKAVSLARLTVALDGKSMTISVRDLRDGSTSEFTMRKQ